MFSIKKNMNFFSGIEIKVLLAFLAIVLGTLGFLILAGLVMGGRADNIDMRIVWSLRDPAHSWKPVGPQWLFEIMRDITSLGGATIVFLITLFAAGYFFLRKEYTFLALILIAIIGGVILDYNLKEFFGRVRPSIYSYLADVKSYGFPSGHSMMSTIVYLSLAAIMARMQERRINKIYILSVALFLTFIIGISRVYLGAHFPTDVLAGWSIGLAWAALCWYVSRRFYKKKSEKPVTTDISLNG
jgi:undecaprenyl-diphosphatase